MHCRGKSRQTEVPYWPPDTEDFDSCVQWPRRPWPRSSPTPFQPFTNTGTTVMAEHQSDTKEITRAIGPSLRSLPNTRECTPATFSAPCACHCRHPSVIHCLTIRRGSVTHVRSAASPTVPYTASRSPKEVFFLIWFPFSERFLGLSSRPQGLKVRLSAFPDVCLSHCL